MDHDRLRSAQTETRTRTLAALGALDVLPSQDLRRTARLAAHLARSGGRLPMAAVHLLDGESMHRVGETGGLPRGRSSLEDSLCLHVVEGGRAVYTADATGEPTFAGNPNVTGPDPVRLYYGTPLRLSDGTVVGTLCVLDVHAGELSADQRARLDDLAVQAGVNLELSGLTRELAHLATHDPLTGVANRLKVSQELAAAFAAPDRPAHEPSLIVVDLDDFKAVNDRFGHGVGDEVLAGTAGRLTASVREQDLVGRLGGDEFVVLLRDLPDIALVDEVAAQIRERTLQPYDTSAGSVLCSVSVGAALGQAGDLAYELLGRADAHMYERKQVDR